MVTVIVIVTVIVAMPKQTTTWMRDSRTLKNQEALVFELGNSISISDRKSLETYLFIADTSSILHAIPFTSAHSPHSRMPLIISGLSFAWTARLKVMKCPRYIHYRCISKCVFAALSREAGLTDLQRCPWSLDVAGVPSAAGRVSPDLHLDASAPCRRLGGQLSPVFRWRVQLGQEEQPVGSTVWMHVWIFSPWRAAAASTARVIKCLASLWCCNLASKSIW